jgi:hypothetical protein
MFLGYPMIRGIPGYPFQSKRQIIEYWFSATRRNHGTQWAFWVLDTTYFTPRNSVPISILGNAVALSLEWEQEGALWQLRATVQAALQCSPCNLADPMVLEMLVIRKNTSWGFWKGQREKHITISWVLEEGYAVHNEELYMYWKIVPGITSGPGQGRMLDHGTQSDHLTSSKVNCEPFSIEPAK